MLGTDGLTYPIKIVLGSMLCALVHSYEIGGVESCLGCATLSFGDRSLWKCTFVKQGMLASLISTLTSRKKVETLSRYRTYVVSRMSSPPRFVFPRREGGRDECSIFLGSTYMSFLQPWSDWQNKFSSRIGFLTLVQKITLFQPTSQPPNRCTPFSLWRQLSFAFHLSIYSLTSRSTLALRQDSQTCKDGGDKDTAGQRTG